MPTAYLCRRFFSMPTPSIPSARCRQPTPIAFLAVPTAVGHRHLDCVHAVSDGGHTQASFFFVILLRSLNVPKRSTDVVLWSSITCPFVLMYGVVYFLLKDTRYRGAPWRTIPWSSYQYLFYIKNKKITISMIHFYVLQK
jgi:hypothetical protein